MKKKIILLMILTLIGISPVKAISYDADMQHFSGSGGTISSASDACKYKHIFSPFYDSSGSNRLQGVRITVVDQNGSRVAGTVSADFVSTSSVFTSTPNNLGTIWEIKAGISPDYKKNAMISHYNLSNRKSLRENKWTDYQHAGASDSETVGVYYWKDLPSYSNLLTYFKTEFVQESEKVFSILRYNDYNNPEVYSNHYLLVEPVTTIFVRTPNANCSSWNDFTTHAYYGTGIELFKTIRFLDTEFADSSSGIAMFRTIARSLYTTETRAGLEAGSIIVNNDAKLTDYIKNMTSKTEIYGIAAGLVWVSDIETGGNYCIDSNGVKHQYTSIEEKNRLCPTQNYCIDKNGKTQVIPAGKTKNDICPGTTITKRYCPAPYNYIEIPDGYTQEQVCGCQYSTDLTVSGDCINGNGGTIRDTYTRFGNYDFNCIYDAINKSVGTYEGEFYSPNGDTTFSGFANSNPYCTVTCAESVSYYFPSTFSIIAGNNFTIGNAYVVDSTYATALSATDYYYVYSGHSTSGINEPDLVGQERVHPLNGRHVEDVCADHESRGEVLNGQCGIKVGTLSSFNILNPVKIVGTSTCYTGYMPTGNGTHSNNISINIEQFKRDYATANTNVQQKWDEVLKAQANLQALANAVNDQRPKREQREHSCTATYAKTGTCVGDGNYNVTYASASGFRCTSSLTNSSTCRNNAWTTTGYNANTTVSTNSPEQVCENARNSCGPAGASQLGDYCRSAVRCNITPCTHGSTETYSNDQCPSGGFPHDGERYYYHTTYTGTYTIELTVGGNYNASQSYTVHVDKNGATYDSTYNSVKSSLESALSSAMSAYNAAVSARDNVVNKLRACTNFRRTYKEFDPGLDFVYSETKYKANYSLSGTAQVTASNNVGGSLSTSGATNINAPTYITDSSNVGPTTTISKWVCGGNQKCETGYETYPTSTTVRQTTTKTYTYNLPNNVYRYVAKNGVSYNTATEAALSNYPYVDVGFSNLPVHYSTPATTYNYYLEYYYSNGTPNLFGLNQKYMKYNKIQPGSQETYNGLVMSSTLKYHCTYNVTSGLQEQTCTYNGEERVIPEGETAASVCPNCVGDCSNVIKTGDVNVIYRPIDLKNPFPGESGNGRSSGSNWIGTTSSTGQYYDYVYAYIKNNRGVSASEVYNIKPMYEFYLNSANIRKIRSYNKNQKNNYNDYQMECTNGLYCKSNFLKNGIKDGYFSFTRNNSDGGTCYNATNDTWETCRYRRPTMNSQ